MTVNALIAELRTQLELLPTNDARREAIVQLLQGFCVSCGRNYNYPGAGYYVCACRSLSKDGVPA